MLTGYQGSPGVAEVVLATVDRVRRLNPDAVYCCDPVMGDVGRGMFVLPGLPELIREQVVPRADIVTPNLFELQYLATGVVPENSPTRPRSRRLGHPGQPAGRRAARPRRRAAHRAGDLGRRRRASARGEIGMLAVDDTGAYLVRTPRLPVAVNGAGDVTAALFLAHLPDGIEAALGPRRVVGLRDPGRDRPRRLPGDPSGAGTIGDRRTGLRVRRQRLA